MPFYFESNTSDIHVKQLIASHYDLYQNSPTYRQMVDSINATGKTVLIGAAATGSNPVTDVASDGSIIIALPADYLKSTNYVTNQSTGDNEIQSLERVLSHEMKHAEEYADGTLDPSNMPTDGSHELRAVDAENDAMFEFAGEEDRDGYAGSTVTRTPDNVYTSNPDSSSPDDFLPTNPLTPPPVTIHKGDDPFGAKGNPGTQNNFSDDAEGKFDNAEANGSPLILDIDGDGIELTSLTSAGAVYWDIDLDGFAESTGWVGADDGLLSIDLNEDGIINDSSELFGDQTGFSNGFLALAAHDSNGDGVIDTSDDVWSGLLVFQDANGDGYSQITELHTLDSLNITEIDLGYSDVSTMIAGNEIKQESTFTINGNTHDIVDAYFSYSDLNSVYFQNYSLDIDAYELADARGYGELPNLHIAMSVDNDDQNPDSLISLVADLASLSFADLLDAT